jgi:hypothetical protein
MLKCFVVSLNRFRLLTVSVFVIGHVEIWKYSGVEINGRWCTKEAVIVANSRPYDLR